MYEYRAQASASKFLRKHGYFDLLGCDFMITDDNQLLLIEINTNPALSLDNSTLEKLLPGVVDDSLDIVLKLQGPDAPLSVKSSSRSKGRVPDAAQAGSSTATTTTAEFIAAKLGFSMDNQDSQYELIFDEDTGFTYGN